MFSSPAYAQAAGAAGTSTSSTIFFVFQFVLIGLIFYFLIIRPQQKRAREHRALIDAVKKGDQVVTAGGLVGKVIKLDDNYVDLELGPNVRVKAVRATIGEVLSPVTGTPAND